MVYDALLDDDFISLRLTDPDVGKVDDLVLVLRGGVNAYQFKSAEPAGTLTLGQLLAATTTRSDSPGPSLVRSLADGWETLTRKYGAARVHLVSEHIASIHDRLSDPDGSRPTPEHFAAFLSQVLIPLSEGRISVADVPDEWQHALGRLRDGTGLDDQAFAVHIRSLHFEFGARPPLEETTPIRRRDIITLSDALFRVVSEASDVVVLDRAAVLALVGWDARPLLRSRHEFPVELETYSPLQGAIDDLDHQLSSHVSGYVALVGPPGAGKSTLLSQALSGRPERVVRYYAFLPSTTGSRTRMTGTAMLHDLVVMLHQAGLSMPGRELAAEDSASLRAQFAAQLDAAGQEYLVSGRRTLIVVDGLDHVERDHPGQDTLLGELPLPSALPDGVLVVVGARALSPLHARARQQVEERASVVDLQHHRLSSTAIVEICRRSPVTATAPPDVHERIAGLSGGHPLALSYLLNRVRDDPSRPTAEVLLSAPAYAGDVAQEYRAAWDPIEQDPAMLSLLAVVARLRVGFSTDWLRTWAGAQATITWSRSLRYLFRPAHDGWRFFHDSFRQFAVDRTAVVDGEFNEGIDRDWHARAAVACANSADAAVLAEQLFHYASAGEDDTVLELAQQSAFRRQFLDLRSPELIREDLGIALRIAADRIDVPVMLRLLLALVEVHDRARALDDIDVPGALLAAGLVGDAVRYCGEHARRVPLAHAYGLAAALAQLGEASGRALFDMIDHEWRSTRARTSTNDSERDAAVAWVRAAVWHRPVGTILSAIHVVENEEDQDSYRAGARLRTSQGMREALIDALDAADRVPDLHHLSKLLAEQADTLAASVTTAERDDEDDPEGLSPSWSGTTDDNAEALANLGDAQVLVLSALSARTVEDDARRDLGERVARALKARPIHLHTALTAAELLATSGHVERADEVLARLPYDGALTVNALSSSGEPQAVPGRFRYWRLRHIAAAATGAAVPASTPPNEATPAGDNVNPTAPVHTFTDAIELAARIDRHVRTLAEIDARTELSAPVPMHDAWSAIVPILQPFRPAAQSTPSSTFHGVQQHRRPLLLLVVQVAEHHSPQLITKIADYLTSRISSAPDEWPLHIRASLGRRLRDAGITVAWYEPTLEEQRIDADGQDVSGRLDALADLVHVYAADGHQETAQAIVRSLPNAAFGVGYRKDYQFTEWVTWLSKAVVCPDGERHIPDAGWLARLIAAAEPRTEGAPARAAVHLPAAVTGRDANAAIRVFEFLVGHGTVSHIHALAALVAALLTDVTEPATVAVAGDLISEIIAPASGDAHENVAVAFTAAASRLLPTHEAGALVDAVASKAATRALGTTREMWRRAFGLPVPPAPPAEASPSDYGSLTKKDGTVIARGDVPAMADSVESIIRLRRDESADSTFNWAVVLAGRAFTSQQISEIAVALSDGTSRTGQGLATLAEAAEAAGDTAQAIALATAALSDCDPRGWATNWDGGGRRRAAAVLSRTGGRDGRLAAARDLTRQAVETDWLAAMLLDDLSGVAVALDPDTNFAETWDAVREYLVGMSTSIDFPADDPLACRGARWWMPTGTSGQDLGGTTVDPNAALVEIAVRHLTHPAWVVREGAARTVARALIRRPADTAAALMRLTAGPDGHADDVLESAGRAVMGARQHGATGLEVAVLDAQLKASASAVLRELTAEPADAAELARPLPPLYRIVVPPSDPDLLGYEEPLLDPHRFQYAILAEVAQLDLNSILAAAARYARQLIETYPDNDGIQRAMSDATMEIAYPTPGVWASRAAFGRVLADLEDSGLLVALPPLERMLLRTVDPALVVAEPVSRPLHVPPPPPAGHEQRADGWLATVTSRVEEYLRVLTGGGWSLLAGTCKLTVLNWELLEEQVTWTTAPAAVAGTGIGLGTRRGLLLSDIAQRGHTGPVPPGAPLFVRNNGWTLHQWAAEWVALRPDVATSLGWIPDSAIPGRWRTADGAVVVERLWWVDGWWGRFQRAFDDTAAEGHAVVVSRAGLAALLDRYGHLSAAVTVTRRTRQGDEMTASGRRVLNDSHVDHR